MISFSCSFGQWDLPSIPEDAKITEYVISPFVPAAKSQSVDFPHELQVITLDTETGVYLLIDTDNRSIRISNPIAGIAPITSCTVVITQPFRKGMPFLHMSPFKLLKFELAAEVFKSTGLRITTAWDMKVVNHLFHPESTPIFRYIDVEERFCITEMIVEGQVFTSLFVLKSAYPGLEF